MKRKKYWAGFSNNVIQATLEAQFGYDNEAQILAIYLKKRDAFARFQDVRPVEIRILKRLKK